MNRPYILGIAILMVIVYHLFCWVYNPISIFNIGYVGVDVFLFFSGFGLSYSFQKNSIKEFYKRRFFKIYPLYFIVSILIIALTTTQYTPVGDFIINSLFQITTISYYVDPENSIDWYLNSLFLFYLLFPLLYGFCKRYGFKFYLILVLLCIIVEAYSLLLFKEPLYWKYDCFVSRIPIFCLGILSALNNYKDKDVTRFIKWSLLPVVPLYFVSPFLSVSFLAPMIIYVCDKLSKTWKSSQLEYLGNYTLELYCANLIVWKVLLFTDSILIKLLLFVIVQIVMSIFFIHINKYIKKYI